jgi:CHAD domain-containing protein
LPVDKPKIRWEGSRSVGENARDKLPELARSFFAAGRELGEGEPPLDALHRFRLLTKRFRYTLELFRPCYGPGLTRRIDSLRTLQQYLGEINDCATAQEMLLDRDDLRKAERDRLLRYLKELAEARMISFLHHWQEDFAQPKWERWWTDYLCRFAVAKRRSRAAR